MFGRNFFSQSVGSTAVQVFDPPTRTGDFKKIKINKWEEGKQKKKKGSRPNAGQLKKKKKRKRRSCPCCRLPSLNGILSSVYTL